MSESLRRDRDRYVAFAFAAADILIECDRAGVVVAAAGAAQTLCGHDLTGTRIVELFASRDRLLARRHLRRIAERGRIDPAWICLHHDTGSDILVLMGGCLLPNVTDRLFVTLTATPPAIAASGDERPRDPETGLLGKETLLAVAASSAKAGHGSAARLTLLHLAGLAAATRRLPADRANLLMGEIGAAIRAESAGGDAAGRLGAEAFGLVEATPGNGTSRLERDIGEAARTVGLAAEECTTRVASIDLTSHSLNEHDAARAIAYAVRRFSESQGEAFTLSSLETGLNAEVATTAARFGDLRQRIVDGRFSLAFQPIVTLPARELHHYEALARFGDDESPQEVIAFSEEVGLVEELDLAVCRKAMAELEQADGLRVAINLSGRSAQREGFRNALAQLLRSRPNLRGRLIFELTESSAVELLGNAASFLQWLKRQGYPVCLDDFGSGAAAYSYLRHFDVDFVKIDGPFLKAAVANQRERTLIGSICRLCHDLGCEVVGEMIEDEAMLAVAEAMGIELGQGWLFGKPGPLSLRPAPAQPVRLPRRQGVVPA